MDTANVQTTQRTRQKGANVFAIMKAKAGSLRLNSLQATLILPYVVLTLIIAGIGLFIVTRLVVDSERERFYNGLVESSRVANDGIVRQEKLQLDRLRQVAFATDIPAAIAAKDPELTTKVLVPNLATNRFDLITAIDANGLEIVTWGKPQNGESATNLDDYYHSSGIDFSDNSAIHNVLSGKTDKQGDKYIDIILTQQGQALFTIAPVRDSKDQIIGAVMAGSYLKTVLISLKEQAIGEIVLFDSQGNLIETTVSPDLEGYNNLPLLFSKLTSDSKLQEQDIELDQRHYRAAFSPLVIREQPVGWIGILKNSEYLTRESVASRNMFIGLFSSGTIAVIIVGFFLAQSIARPILKLRSLSQSVAAGDLNQKIGLVRSDEIGDLADAFDVMTLHLRERTEDATRLYAESLQRNRELAEINAKLEAAQLQLIQSEKLAAIGQLTAGIVHDVKNPFAVIMGMSEVLADDDAMDESIKQGLKVIRESAVKGNTIVSDLLKFARQSKPEMRCSDLGETVKTAQRLTAYLTRKYTQNNELPDHPLMVIYDAQQIEQVLINLIHNAVQAMPNNGTLNVILRQVDDKAQVSIQDTGSGISPENLKRIFDPFFTTKPEGEGTGLGLSVSYGIIANHSGKIEATSELGIGTTFTVTLPMVQPSSDES